MEGAFRLPTLPGPPDADGWVTETLRYRVSPRPKPKFHTVLDTKHVFANGEGEFVVTTRVRAPERGKVALELHTRLRTPALEITDRFEAVWHDGLRPGRLVRTSGAARHEEVDFQQSPYPLPDATYPDVLIPFLMRGQPRDGERRALCSWTNDRFVARVYYESRDSRALEVPAGKIHATEVWMYPDLNDWVSLGSVLTKLAKPLLPRYEMWFEDSAPHRVARFEGSFGPPGAPEVQLELIGAA